MKGAEVLKQQLELCSGIMALAMHISQNTKHDIFVDYSPHVDMLALTFHVGGWLSGNPVYSTTELCLIHGEELQAEFTLSGAASCLNPYKDAKTNLVRMFKLNGCTKHLEVETLQFKVKYV
jgi:hypothetical protein